MNDLDDRFRDVLLKGGKEKEMEMEKKKKKNKNGCGMIVVCGKYWYIDRWACCQKIQYRW